MAFFVETAEYAGEGYWYDYPPLEFETEKEANDFAEVVNMNKQMGGTTKVRRVYEGRAA